MPLSQYDMVEPAPPPDDPDEFDLDDPTSVEAEDGDESENPEVAGEE